MTKDEIMKMAREAGINFRPLYDGYCDMVGLDRGTICRVESIGDEEIRRFASLIAAAEREACADILDRNADRCDPCSIAFDVLDSNAKAIRARSQK